MRALSPEKSDNFCRRNSDVSQRCSSVEKTTFGMHKSSQIESCPATSLVELKTSGGIKWTENLVHKHNRTFFNGIEIRFPKVRLKRCNDSIQNFSSTLDSEVISINDISSFSPSSSDGEKAEKQLHEVSRKKQKKRFMQISAETSSRGSNRSISVDDFGSTSDDGHSTSAIGWNSLSGMQTQPTFLALKPIPTLDQQLIREKRFDSFNAHNFDNCVKPHVCSVDQQGRRGFSKKVKLGKCRCKEIDFSSECKCLHVCSSCAFLQENEVEKESNELDGCTSHIRLNGQREFDLEENKDVIFRERPLPVVDNEELDSIDSDTPLIQVFEKLKKSSKKKKRKFRPHKESCAKKIRQPLDESERSPRFAPEKETKQKRHDDLENPKEEDSKTSEHLLADRPVSCTSLKFRHSQKGKRWLWDAFSYLSQSGIDKEDELVKPEHCALRNKQLVPASDLSNVDLESNSDSDTLPDVDFLLSTCRSDDRLNASDLSNVDRESDSDTLPDVDFLLSTCRSDDGLNASTVLHPEKNHQQVNEKNNTCTSETNKNYTPVDGQRQNTCDEQVQNSSRDIDWQRNSNLNLISLSDDTTSEAENEGSKGEKSHLRNQFLRTRMLNTQTRSLGKAKGWRNPEIMVEKKQKIATDSNVVCSKFGEPKTENGSNRKCVQNIGLMSGKSQKLDGLEQTCKLIKENELKINLDNLLKSSSLTSVDQGQSDLDKRGEPKEIGGLLTIKTEPRSQNDENESSKVADNLGKSGALKAEPETVTNFSAMSSHCCPGSAIKSEEPESEFSYSQEDEVILIYDSEDAETLKDLSLEQHSSEEKSNDKTYKAAYRGSSRNNKSFDDVLGKTESDLFGTLRTKARSLSSNELFEECYKMSDSQYKYREKEAKQKPMDVSFDSDDSDKSSSCGKTKFLSLSEKSIKPNLFESFSLSTAEFGDDNFRKKFKKSSKSHTVSSSGDASSVCAELLPKHMSPVLSDKDGEHIDACSTSTQVRSTQQNFREIRRFPETSVPVPYRCSTSGVSGFSGKLKCISKLEKWSHENDEDDILYQNETQVNREEADVDTSVSLLIEKNKVKHLSKVADLEEIDSDDDLYLDQTQVDTSFSLPVKENKVKHRSKVADLEEIDSDDDLYLDQTQVDTSFSLPVKENKVKHRSKVADLEEIDSDDDLYLDQTQVDTSFNLPVKENKVKHLSKAADLDDDLYLVQTQVDTGFSLPVKENEVKHLSKAADLKEIDSDDDQYLDQTQVDTSFSLPVKENEVKHLSKAADLEEIDSDDDQYLVQTQVDTSFSLPVKENEVKHLSKAADLDDDQYLDQTQVDTSFSLPVKENEVKHLSKAADLEEIDSDDDQYLVQTQVDASFSLPVKENKVQHLSKAADLDDDLYLDQTQVDTSFSLPVKENEVKHLNKAAGLEEIDSDDDQYLVQTQVNASFSLPVKENKVQHLSKAADLDDDLYLDQTQVDTSFSLPVAKSKVQRLSKAADLEEVDSDDDLYSRLTQVDDRTKSDSLEFPNEISRIALTRKKHCFEISDYTSVTPTYVNTGVKPCESDREYSVDKDKVRSSFTKPPDFFKAETSKMEQKMLEEKYDLEGRLYYNAMKIDSKKNGRSIKKEDEDICPPVIQASKDFKQQLNLFSICENLPHCKSLSNRRKNNLSNKKIQCLHEIKAQNKFKKPELTFSTKDIKKLDNQDDDDVYCSTTQVDNNKAALSSDEDDLYNIATQMPIDGSMKKKSKAYDKKKKEITQQNYENKDDSLYLAATQVVDFDSDNKTSSLFQKNSNSEHFSFNEDSCSLSPCGSPEIEDGIYEGATLVDDADTTESAGKVSLPDHLSLKSASSERLESRDSETYQLMPARNATKLAVEIQPQRWKSRQEMRKSFILKKNLSLDEGQHDTMVNKPGCNLVSRQLSADSCKGLSKKKACSPKSPLDQKRKRRHWKKALPSVSLREKIVEAKHQLAERMFRKVVDPQFPKPVRKMTNLSSDSSNVPQYMTDVSLPDEAEIMKKGLPLLSADMLILKNRQSTEKQETYQNLFPESCRFTASGKMTEEENEQECKGKDAWQGKNLANGRESHLSALDAAKQIAATSSPLNVMKSATKDGGLPTLQEGNLLHCIDGNKRNEDRQLDKIAGSLNNLLVEQDYSSKFTKLTTTMLEFSDKHSESHQKPVDQPRAIQRKKLNNRSCNLGQNSLLQDKMNVPNYSNSLSYPGTSHGQSYSLVPVTTSNSSDATLPSNRYKPVSINMDSFFAEILKWHPKWLDEQEKVKHLPPVINHKQLLPLLEMYESFSDYHQIMKPLLLLETWESISKDWKRNRDSGKNHSYKLAFGNVQILPTTTTTSLMNYVLHGILTKEQADTGRHLLEGDLVVIYLCGMAFPKKPEDRMCQSYPVMGYVEKVRINTVPNNMQHLMKFPVLSKTLVRNSDGFRTYTVTIKGCYRKIVPNTEKLMEIKLVASIVTQIRHYHALLALPSSKLMKHILQPGDPAVFLSFQKNRSAGTSQYNSSQMQAICSSSSLALKPLSQPAICLLQGPPGTGKSYTIIGIIKKLIKDSERKAKILLCAPSNAAVDELTRRLIVERHAVSRKDTKAALRIVRIGNTESIDEDVVNYSLSMLIKKNARIKKNSHLESMHKELQRIYTRKKYIQNQLNETGICLEDVWKLNKDLKGLIEKEKILKSTTASASKIYDAQTLTYKEEVTIRRSILLKADVICSTLNSMGSNMLLSDFNTHSLTCAIIDEAAQSIELDSLIPLQYGISKLILVGDTEQLPPTVLSRRTAELSYGLSLFERLCNYFRDNSPDHNPILMLDTQYRMAVQICQFPNRYIYNNKLITSNHCSMNEKSINFPLQPYLVFDVKQGQECSAGLGSISNPIEADFTVMLCKCIIQKAHLPPSSSIGIIAPYQKQKVLLRELLRQNNVHDIEISTLDGFQGREKDVIIMSCVRARSNNGGIGEREEPKLGKQILVVDFNPEDQMLLFHGLVTDYLKWLLQLFPLQFLANRRRMNVSLTRAKFALYVVGHLDSLQTDEDWRSLVADAKARDLVVPIFHPATFCEAAQKCLKNSF